MSFANKIGFMQGRFTSLVNGKIQAFPWMHWQEEFVLASRYGFGLMEWTLDQEHLARNPLMTDAGFKEIKQLIDDHGVTVPSLTGDCFMQSPFYKVAGHERAHLLNDLEDIVLACARLGIKLILIPLVDNGRLENKRQEEDLLQGMEHIFSVLEKTGVVISFESDFTPHKLARFISRLDSRYFGITYDIGNSAAFGYLPQDEISAYGGRIVNVHVKDRILGGSTVPLGKGSANIPAVVHLLLENGYCGNFILQTARATNNDHAGSLCFYRDMLLGWLNDHVSDG